MTFHVEKISRETSLRTFLEAYSPHGLYRVQREDQHLISPVLTDDIRAWTRGIHPGVDSVELYVLREERTELTAAQFAVHTSTALDAKLREAGVLAGAGATLYFGAVEYWYREALDAALNWIITEARRRGARHVFGPTTLLPNQTSGAVTSGFQHPGFFDSPYNGPELPAALQAQGFTPWYPAATWEVTIADIPPERRRRPSAQEYQEAGVRAVNPGRLSLRGEQGTVERLRQGLNAAFAQLPYFTPIAKAQMVRQTSGLELLADPRLVVLLESAAQDKAPASLESFALVVPDPVDVLRSTGGQLRLRDLPRLAFRRLRPVTMRGDSLRDAVLIVQGTRPSSQGRGLLSLVSRQLFAELHAAGYRRLRITAVGEDNPRSAAVFAKAGGRQVHTLSCFVKDLAGDSSPAPADSYRPGQWIEIAGRAPSAHNTQPWNPTVSATGMELGVHCERTLPVGDPTHRDLYLSLGCWIESLDIAAAADGWAVKVGEISGTGAELTVGLRFATDDREVTETVDDVLHRRVYRGQLYHGWNQLVAAAQSAGLPGVRPETDPENIQGLQLRTLPPTFATALEQTAAKHSTSSAELIDELVEWLRLDRGHPRWGTDGLNAECLLLHQSVGIAGRVLRTRVGARIAAGLTRVLAHLAPSPTPGALRRAKDSSWDYALHRQLPGRVAAKLSRSLRGVPPGTQDSGPDLAPMPDDRRGTPVVLLKQTENRELTPEEMITAGRSLQLFWLQLHRLGLAVHPHSEVLDAEVTGDALVQHLTAHRPDHTHHTASAPRSRTVALAYFRVGIPDDVPPRSARRTTR